MLTHQIVEPVKLVMYFDDNRFRRLCGMRGLSVSEIRTNGLNGLTEGL